MHPVNKFVDLNGVRMSYFEWESESEITVLLCHATGFHGRCWDAVVKYLQPHVRVVAVEFRGHGRSAKTAPFTWQTFSDDLCLFLDSLALERVVGVGHSMGGFSVLCAAANHPSRFESLLLLDPVIMPPESYRENANAARYASVDEHPIARRVNHWSSPQAMFENLSSRHPFSLWQSDVLLNYCQYGLELEETLSGSEKPYQLCCPPNVEATIYIENSGFDPGSIFDQVEVPTLIYRAETRDTESTQLDFSKSPTWPLLANHLPNAKDFYLPFLSHFIPMQDPFLVATQINQLVTQR